MLQVSTAKTTGSMCLVYFCIVIFIIIKEGREKLKLLGESFLLKKEPKQKIKCSNQ